MPSTSAQHYNLGVVGGVGGVISIVRAGKRVQRVSDVQGHK